jgi:hypothetical protein
MQGPQPPAPIGPLPGTDGGKLLPDPPPGPTGPSGRVTMPTMGFNLSLLLGAPHGHQLNSSVVLQFCVFFSGNVGGGCGSGSYNPGKTSMSVNPLGSTNLVGRKSQYL